jgi:hypothetical protein
VSEATKASYLRASFLMSFLFLLSFFKSSTEADSKPKCLARSRSCWSPMMLYIQSETYIRILLISSDDIHIDRTVERTKCSYQGEERWEGGWCRRNACHAEGHSSSNRSGARRSRGSYASWCFGSSPEAVGHFDALRLLIEIRVRWRIYIRSVDTD